MVRRNGDHDKENNPSSINMLHHLHRSLSESSFSTHSSMPSLESIPRDDDDFMHTLLYYETRGGTDPPVSSSSDETTRSDSPEYVRSYPIRDSSVSTVHVFQGVTISHLHESELQRMKFHVAACTISRYLEKYLRKRSE